MNAPPDRIIEGLLAAYREGWFPMARPGEPDAAGRFEWHNPDPRGVLPLEPARFIVARSLRRQARAGGDRGGFTIRADTAFERVMHESAQARPGDEGTWINDDLIAAYTLLHRAGHAHSVEAWLPSPGSDGTDGGRLVGGLYGVSIGGAFFGESMFSRPELGGTDSSKVCLVHLVYHLRRRGYTLLDTQFSNPHLARFGCGEIPRAAYLTRLAEAIKVPVDWPPFDAAATVVELGGARE